jgi:hypothetical protein
MPRGLRAPALLRLMVASQCAACGNPADMPVGDDWYCADCEPPPTGHAVRVVNAWQAVTARLRGAA